MPQWLTSHKSNPSFSTCFMVGFIKKERLSAPRSSFNTTLKVCPRFVTLTGFGITQSHQQIIVARLALTRQQVGAKLYALFAFLVLAAVCGLDPFDHLAQLSHRNFHGCPIVAVFFLVFVEVSPDVEGVGCEVSHFFR